RQIWDTRVNNHNLMIDSKGRVWLTASVRGRDNPTFCKEGSDHPSAKLYPLKQSSRQLAMLDPKTMKYTFIDTCLQTHHLQFGFDDNDTLWTSGGGPVVGWLGTQPFRATWGAGGRSSAGSTPSCSTKLGTRRRRKAGRRWWSIPAATASATPMSSRTRRPTRRRTSGSKAASTRSCQPRSI